MIEDTPYIRQKITLNFSINRHFGEVNYMVILVVTLSATTFDEPMKCSTSKQFKTKDEFIKFAKESLLYFDNLGESYVEYDYIFNSKNEWIGYKAIEVYNDDFEFTDPDSIDVDDEK